MPAKGSVAVALRMKEKQAITKEVAKRYLRAKKKEKTKMLDEFGRDNRIQSLIRYQSASLGAKDRAKG